MIPLGVIGNIRRSVIFTVVKYCVLLNQVRVCVCVCTCVCVCVCVFILWCCVFVCICVYTGLYLFICVTHPHVHSCYLYLGVCVIVSGTDTTATALTCLMLVLLHHRQVQQRLQQEVDRVIGHTRSPSLSDRPLMPYTEAVLMELLRQAAVLFPRVQLHIYSAHFCDD